MAIVQNPITGKTRGKFATAVFQFVYEKNIMRAKVVTYHDKQSDSQLNLRSRFSLLQRIASYAIILVRIGFKFDSYLRSAYSSFISYNSQFFDFNAAPKVNNFHLLQLSQGLRIIPLDFSCNIDFNNKQTLCSWSLPLGSGVWANDDEIQLLFCDENFRSFVPYNNYALRSDLSCNPVLPDYMYLLDKVYCYAFFSKNHNSVVQKSDILNFCSSTVFILNSQV